METLTLKSLRFKGYHGYYEKERQQGNDFEVDIIFSADLRKAGDSDQLDDTIDYQEVLSIVKEVMHGPSQKLIETLAKRIGDQLFGQFSQVQSIEVSVRKLHPPLDIETAYSEITMQWQR
ncbi:dihydroneopterin aldolase [Fodinibius sp. SL11]|uniref:dihydroneopterin aldolase n=1 Tax=Fodinibius sp. SL11 TaxID=3425690 RepID=UPI003F8846FC